MSFCPFCGERTESDEKFCSFCGASLQTKERNTGFDSDENICKSCGTVLNSFDAVCPSCGRDVSVHKTSGACRELIEKLDRIEMSRPQPGTHSNMDSILSAVASRYSVNYKSPVEKEMEKAEEIIRKQKFECISHFIVPNNKSDIIEFLFLAQANINAYEVAAERESSIEYGAEEFIELWQNKYEETYKKACVLLADDPQFRAIKKERDDKEEAERLRKENTFSKRLMRKIKSSLTD